MTLLTNLHRVTALAATAMILSACGGGSDTPPAPPPAPDQPPVAQLVCDDTLKAGFKPDTNTSVILVKAFKAGDPLIVSGAASASTPKAANDMCLVKMIVGPGNPGPAQAQSTSPGIGIEVWLPSKVKWNKRIHALGGGGWAGGTHTLPTTISNGQGATIAGKEGAVSSSTDTGHSGLGSTFPPVVNGSWTLNPDGSINQATWKDFASRAIYELAVKTKALTTAYYGSPAKYSYWEGGSTGGRQGLRFAQEFPEISDGKHGWRSFVNTLRRDYMSRMDLRDVATVRSTRLHQLLTCVA